MSAKNSSKLLRLRVGNLRCIDNEGIEIHLDNVVCLVGKNNAGKSSILRAYELAQGSEAFTAEDRCRWASDDHPSFVELDVHIPDGMGNVDDKWKRTEGEYRVVRSRWEWSAANGYQVERRTFDPSNNTWAEDGKAGGADNVFKSRLPQPLRISSLEDAVGTEQVLLALALEPFVNEVSGYESDDASPLSKAVKALVAQVDEMAIGHKERFDEIADKVQTGFKGVFPDLDVVLDVSMAQPQIKMKDLLKAGSGIKVREGPHTVSLTQQGTGARRALFWSMLQVHNAMKRDADARAAKLKVMVKERDKAKDEAKKAEFAAMVDALAAGGPLPADDDDPSLPGYVLLIDEPENALHPMAARLAQKHLYALADDDNWQVMMTTHSPYFVNPLEDHTTIVRLEREDGGEAHLKHKTYRTDRVDFSDDEKAQLQGLQQMDTGFSEVFFGSYPIVVEGDTEHAAFLGAVVESAHPIARDTTVIRARGKAIIPALVRMLAHFQVNFSLLHDIDWPFTSEGKAKSSMWTVNKTILDEVIAARARKVRVRHQCSLPDFERELGRQGLSSGKPLDVYLAIAKDKPTAELVAKFFENLRDGDTKDDSPFGFDPASGDDYLKVLEQRLCEWAAANGMEKDSRLTGAV